VSNREIANINSFLNFLAISNPVEANNISEDINIDEPRGRFIISSGVISKAILAHSDILSIPYVKRMKAQINDLFWFGQTKQENFQLLYISSKGRIYLTRTRPIVPPIHLVHMLKVRCLLTIIPINSIALVSH